MENKMNKSKAMKELRVSVATYNQVVFPHPQNGTTMLALERKATIWKDGTVSVLAQPFGGGVQICDRTSLTGMLGEIQFEEGSEPDFRIFIPPAKWSKVKQYCLLHLANPDDPELEAIPDRELREEFEQTMHVGLKPNQYTVQPIGFVIEDNPVPTKNWRARGRLTVRVYRTFKVEIMDVALCKTILAVSEQVSDRALGMLALKNGKGRANSTLALPLNSVAQAWLALPPEMRYTRLAVEDHELDESVLAILGDVDVPQYQRVREKP
jgi:hypothetical protein